MGGKLGRKFSVVVIALSAVSALAVVAQPSGAADGFVYKFNYNVDATTHLKKLDQTITISGGTFSGAIDLSKVSSTVDTAPLTGKITLPDATFTYRAAGILPLITATARIVPTKAVRGTLHVNELMVTATATFNIRILSASASGTNINLVGTNCMTSKPIVVTMTGLASFGTASTFSGDFTIPPLQNCGIGTTALNLVMPGPGNTFSAAATPK